MTVLVIVLVALAVALAAAGWFLPAPRRGRARGLVAGALAAVVGALGLVAVLHGPVAETSPSLPDALLVSLFAVAVVGGGPLTAAVLRLVDSVDSGEPDPARGAHAAEVLRGGAWIGAFERTAVFATLAAGWPEGLAVMLALKGLGRYSELRADAGQPGVPSAPGAGGVAERFIIGTFASVLWAVACAGVHVGLTR